MTAIEELVKQADQFESYVRVLDKPPRVLWVKPKIFQKFEGTALCNLPRNILRVEGNTKLSRTRIFFKSENDGNIPIKPAT